MFSDKSDADNGARKSTLSFFKNKEKRQDLQIRPSEHLYEKIHVPFGRRIAVRTNVGRLK